MKADRKILAIAIKHFDSIKKRGDLRSRCNDSEDFVELAVWNIEAALLEAYEAGRNNPNKND